MTTEWFTEKNISSITGRYSYSNRPSLLAETQRTLNAKKTEIEAFVAATGFNLQNFSSMLGQSGKRLPDSLQEILDGQETLTALIADNIFSRKNIASMLSSSGMHMGDAIGALNEHKEKLYQIVRNGRFTANNVASMLGSSGQYIGTAITALDSNREELYALVQDGPFTGSNIASMLRGSGKNIGVAIGILIKNRAQLDAMATIMDPNEIATKLNRVPVNKLNETIHVMHHALKDEIAGSTVVTAGSGAAVAAESEAAQAVAGQERI